MIRLFTQSQSKRAYRKLSQIHVNAMGCALQTTYESIYILVKTELTKPKSLQHYLSAMRNSTPCSQSILKFCVFIHIIAQNGQQAIDPEPLQLYLAQILQLVPKLIGKYENYQAKRDKSIDKSKSRSPTRPSSCNASPANSTRSQSAFVCKEVYLLTHIVRPYIAYLLKFIFSQEQLLCLERQKDGPSNHEAWMLINLLKMATSISNGFTVIGRYFLSSYGHLVVLLTKSLARDINKIMPILAIFVNRENERLSTGIAGIDSNIGVFDEFVRLLQQISKLNEDLYTLYLGKYFAKHLLDVPEPKWIISNSKQFDFVYKSLKMKLNKESYVTKTRSKSTLYEPKSRKLQV